MRIRKSRLGFTLLELLIVIAIIAILVALLVPAVQKVRESSARLTCQNNLKQIALGINNFHTLNKTFPTYHGIYPDVNGDTRNTPSNLAGAYSVYGSWIVHILPYIDQEPLYKNIAADVALYTNTGGTVTSQGGPILQQAGSITPPVPAGSITPATPAYWKNAAGQPVSPTYTPPIPATYNQWNGSLQYVSTTNANGYTVMTQQYVPPKNPDPGTGTSGSYNYTGLTYVPGIAGVPANTIPGVPAAPVYGPPGAPINNGYVGIWNPNYRAVAINVLRCPSDPSYGTTPYAQDGLVYPNTPTPFTATNYLANWNALCVPQPTTNGAGYTARPQSIADITDGASHTILLGEAYAFCEGRGRVAFLAWSEGLGGFSAGYTGVYDGSIPRKGLHNFGLTYMMNPAQVTITGQLPYMVNNANGQSNPLVDPNNPGNYLLDFYFQIRPDPLLLASENGCDSMTVQSGHSVMNVAMVDGSVHSFAIGFDRNMWAAMMLPNDGGKVVLD